MINKLVCLGASLAALCLAGCGPAGAASDQAKPPTGDDVKTAIAPKSDTAPKYSKSSYDITPLPRDQVEQLAKKLDAETYRITQKAGTEPAFCGTLLDNKKEGTYICVVCGLPLFSSEHKFNSGTGWPSFFQPFDGAHVTRKEDRAHGWVRTEINCARCNSHLGHVFDDGPKPTGERHCLNSASLTFIEKGKEFPPQSRPVQTETAYFAGGCFWGIEHYFQQGPGVIDAVSGYMQGDKDNPTYKEVCTDTTGHAETVKVVFDPKRISYGRLLQAFFDMHDPTELNRQGPDVGEQYRSGIYYTSDSQKREAEAFVSEQNLKKRFGSKRIVTQIEQAEKFWPAEDYHQDYIVKTGQACHVADPW
ncbi:MAG: bifunctional methionine sulfoxide reductase B/A protein [Phycisphaerales bacterium]|nr:bifunctional methionine sulfoxide reductase B/A protein [Phycisphaerales bacterium]